MADYAPLNHRHTGVDTPRIEAANINGYLPWDNYFYTFTFFESLDGYTKSGATATIDGTGITLSSTASVNSFCGLSKQPYGTNKFDFAKQSRFRAGVEFSSTANITAYLTHGIYGLGEKYYGFELSNGTLKGSSSNANTSLSNAVTLKTISPNTFYEIEARFAPENKVQFFVDDTLLGSVQSEMPTGNGGTLFDSQVKSGTAAIKSLIFTHFEFLQNK